MPVDFSGFLAARRLLDAAGLTDVGIEQTTGDLNDYYDARGRTVQLSSSVYHGRSVVAVALAARVAGFAMQQARSRLAKLLHHGAAIGAAYGYGPGLIVAVIGVLFTIPAVTVTGALMFNTAFALQLARLPVQWKACVTAKQHLDRLGLADHEQRAAVVRLMNAAALLDFSHAVWGMRFPRQ